MLQFFSHDLYLVFLERKQVLVPKQGCLLFIMLQQSQHWRELRQNTCEDYCSIFEAYDLYHFWLSFDSGLSPTIFCTTVQITE